MSSVSGWVSLFPGSRQQVYGKYENWNRYFLLYLAEDRPVAGEKLLLRDDAVSSLQFTRRPDGHHHVC